MIIILILQVDSIYACVGKTTGDDEYSIIKIFDNKVLILLDCTLLFTYHAPVDP
jgi:hypothetical protein